MKIAVMGGSFDPFHLAHLNSLLTVKEKFRVNQILLIPSFKTPLKEKAPSSSALHRLNMLKQIVAPYSFMEIDSQEILRKGLSYTYKSIQELYKKKAELFFIMGLDQFSLFDLWKNHTEILKKAHLIVTSRPGFQFPKRRSDFPKKLQSFTKSHYLKKEDSQPIKQISYKGDFKNIYFLPLKDKNISSSNIRQRLKNKNKVSHLIPQEINSYIKDNQLYYEEEKAEENQKIDFIKKELEAKKAFHIECYDLRSKPLPFSFAVIASATNIRQTKALFVLIKKKMKDKFKLKPLSEEGQDSSHWIVLDYDDIILHLFYDYTRSFYKLEEICKSSHDTKFAP